MSRQFNGYELHLFRKFQSDHTLASQWLDKLNEIDNCCSKCYHNDHDDHELLHSNDSSHDSSVWLHLLNSIPQHQLFIRVTLEKVWQSRLKNFIPEWRNFLRETGPTYQSPLSVYMDMHLMQELHLDNIFKYGEDNTLPTELFRCSSVRYLSLKYNYLDKIPADIGRMSQLKYLALTNNKLQNKSIPQTLTFCTKLETLLLDNNLLDALPGFLLDMPSLQTVHRHGNHNYFKSTFMWYHTDVTERVLPDSGSLENCSSSWPSTIYASSNRQKDYASQSCTCQDLQFLAAKVLIGSKQNFFNDSRVPPLIKSYLSSVYFMFNICGQCYTAKLITQPGFKVITFMNPYLGNTCVPFQHWACCHECALTIEVPTRRQQVCAAREQDRQYEAYVQQCQQDQIGRFVTGKAPWWLNCKKRSEDGEDNDCACTIS